MFTVLFVGILLVMLILTYLQTLILHSVIFGSGLLLWTLGEYWVHNILCHHRRNKIAAKIHWDHHKVIGGIEKARLDAGTYGKTTSLYIAAAAMPILWVIFSLLLGASFGLTFTLAFITGYLHYEYIHWRIHCRAPRNNYELGLMQHHFAHHYCDPKRYQSVSLPPLDHFFGTMPSPKSQEEHLIKIRSRQPLNGEDNLWAWIHKKTTELRQFPEKFDAYYPNDQQPEEQQSSPSST